MSKGPYRDSATIAATTLEDLCRAIPTAKPPRHAAELKHLRQRGDHCAKCGHGEHRIKYVVKVPPPTDKEWFAFCHKHIEKTTAFKRTQQATDLDLNVDSVMSELIEELSREWLKYQLVSYENWFDADVLAVACARCDYFVGFFRCNDYKE